MWPIAVCSPVKTTTALALPLTTVVPYWRRQHWGVDGVNQGTCGEHDVGHILLDGSRVWNDIGKLVNTDALASKDGLVYTEAA